MDPTLSESPSPAWIDIPWAGLRSIQRGMVLGLVILAGLPSWLAPPAAALLVGWLAWRDSGSRAVSFQGAVDGCLGALLGMGLGQLLAPSIGWAALPVGMGLGAGTSGTLFAMLELIAFKPPKTKTIAIKKQPSGSPDP